jgi:hypothetical protein
MRGRQRCRNARFALASTTPGEAPAGRPSQRRSPRSKGHLLSGEGSSQCRPRRITTTRPPTSHAVVASSISGTPNQTITSNRLPSHSFGPDSQILSGQSWPESWTTRNAQYPTTTTQSAAIALADFATSQRVPERYCFEANGKLRLATAVRPTISQLVGARTSVPCASKRHRQTPMKMITSNAISAAHAPPRTRRAPRLHALGPERTR